MSRRDADAVDREIAERLKRHAKRFDQAIERPHYDPLPTPCNMSRTSFEQCAQILGPAWVYNLYVHPTRLLEARNRARDCYALAPTSPFAPHINIVETEQFDEGEWCLEANGSRVGSVFPW